MKIRKCKYNFGNNNDGVFSTINGYATETNNFGETAVGILNKSTLDPDTFTSPDVVTSSKATLFSVGNGSDNVRKNAFEIKANGDTYINGVGGYDGTNSEDATSVGESIQSVQDSSNKVAEDIESIHIEKSGIGNTYVLKVAGEDRGTITDESGVSFTPGDGLQLVDTDLSVKIDPASESYLTAGQDGLKISGIDAKFGNYLPLSGGTVEYLNIGDYSMRSTGLLYTNSFNITKNGISDFNNPILTIDANNEPSIKMYGNGNYATIHLGYDNTGTNYGAKGVTIQGKTKQDLLNAAGSTTPISNIATQVQAAIVDSAPETLDTLNELAAALGDDPNFATTVTNQIAQKADKTTATTSADGLMSAADKTKLDSIEISTLATKEELDDYLPLTGGTLTGNLYIQSDADAVSYNGITFRKSNFTEDIPGIEVAPLHLDDGGLDELLVHSKRAFYLTLASDGSEAGTGNEYGLRFQGNIGNIIWGTHGSRGSRIDAYGFRIAGKSDTDLYIAGREVYDWNNWGAVHPGMTIHTANGLTRYQADGVTIPNKTASDLLNAAGGTVSIDNLLPIASATQLGGIRVGDGLEITGEGVLNCTIDPGSGTVSWNNIQGKPTFATVATSGLYSDLTGTPDLSNYVTSTQLTSVAGSNTYTGANYISKETNLTDAVVQLDEEIKATNDNLALEHANAEATYVKKTQLKTINSQSLLGEGNIEIQVEGGGITDAPSDNKLYGRKNAQWTEVTVPDTSNFATKTDLDDYLPLTGGGLRNFFDISNFFMLTAGSGHNNNSKVVSFPIRTSSNTLCEMVAYADHNVSMVSGSLKIGYNNFNDPGVGFSGDNPGILMDINRADPRIALGVKSAGQYSLSIGKGGITIPSKTSSDLLHAAGGTTTLKTLGGESILGTGNFDVATEEDIQALFN